MHRRHQWQLPRRSGLTSPLENSPHHTDTLASYYIMRGFSVARYPQLCRLTVPFSLKMASSDQTVRLVKYPFRHTRFCCTIWIALIITRNKEMHSTRVLWSRKDESGAQEHWAKLPFLVKWLFTEFSQCMFNIYYKCRDLTSTSVVSVVPLLFDAPDHRHVIFMPPEYNVLGWDQPCVYRCMHLVVSGKPTVS